MAKATNDPEAYLTHIVYDELRGGWCLTEEGQWLLVQAKIERTHELDRLDVLEGRRPAGHTHFIPASWLRGAKAIFPKKYTMTSTTNLFLDTEWADLNGTQLVSLALVSQDGVHKLYVERDPLPEPGSDFVAHVVYPQLERGMAAMHDKALSERVRTFIARFGTASVIADHPIDFTLLRQLLAQTEPVAWEAVLIDQSEVRGHVLTYFDRHPERRRFLHHAAVDAEALRWAWCYVNEGIV